MLNTPVLLIIFNRPDTTKRVFEAIQQAKPKHLYIAADGPRANKPDEKEKCRDAREIALQVDWECEVKTLFREKNLGCGLAVSSAIDWFFESIDEGIILEDDCLPDLSFFTYCQELLQYYRTNSQVMHIGGNNYRNRLPIQKYTYYFSRYIHPPHGWATWKRAWRNYDFEMKDLENFIQNNQIKRNIEGKNSQQFWLSNFRKTQSLKHTWDDQWQFALWKCNGFAIMPFLNLVQNIGYRSDATHTLNPNSRSNINRVYTVDKIRHPKLLKVNKKEDEFKNSYIFMHLPTIKDKISKCLPQSIKNSIRSVLSRFLINKADVNKLLK